jgi:hypothetical protein
MPRKVTLRTRSEPTSFTLFGISCHLQDFRLSYHLEKDLGLAVEKLDDFRGYSFYYYRDEDCMNLYYLLGNRGEEAILLPDLKQTDFLLLVEGPFKKSQKEKLLKQVRDIPHVLTAFEVRFETIRNYETMLDDLELHFMTIMKDKKTKYSSFK